jgi:hypothetical protein
MQSIAKDATIIIASFLVSIKAIAWAAGDVREVEKLPLRGTKKKFLRIYHPESNHAAMYHTRQHTEHRQISECADVRQRQSASGITGSDPHTIPFELSLSTRSLPRPLPQRARAHP